MPDVTHEQFFSRKRRIVVVIVAWVSVYGLVGMPMHFVTTFLFAFSGQQYRMPPVVNTGFWVVGLCGLLVSLAIGSVAWERGWSTRRIWVAVLLSAALLWILALVVYGTLSFRFSSQNPPPGTFPPGLDLLPPLYPPEGVSLQVIGGPSGLPGHWVSEALASTDQEITELEAAFAQQLREAGWVRLDGQTQGPLAWSVWNIPQGGSDWRGSLYVQELPGQNRRLLRAEADSVHDLQGYLPPRGTPTAVPGRPSSRDPVPPNPYAPPRIGFVDDGG